MVEIEATHLRAELTTPMWVKGEYVYVPNILDALYYNKRIRCG
jgi:hypothetical protein